ncbi:TPA: hypothetical protein ACYLN4_000236 [Burkholderia lata]
MFSSAYDFFSFFMLIQVFYVTLALIVTAASAVMVIVIMKYAYGSGDHTDTTGTPQKPEASGPDRSIASSSDDAQNIALNEAISTIQHSMPNNPF